MFCPWHCDRCDRCDRCDCCDRCDRYDCRRPNDRSSVTGTPDSALRHKNMPIPRQEGSKNVGRANIPVFLM
eukprot:6988023-Prymnesium_polylepis.1